MTRLQTLRTLCVGATALAYGQVVAADERAWSTHVDVSALVCEDSSDAPAATAPTTTALCDVAVTPDEREALRVRFPMLADRLALCALEARLNRDASVAAEACQARDALDSPHPSVVARARVAQTRCLLRAGSPDSQAALDDLLARYPELPARGELTLEQARGWLATERTGPALRSLSDLSVRLAGTAVGRAAERMLADLRAEGVAVPAVSLRDEITRAARLVRSGLPAEARPNLEQLLERPLGAEARVEVLRLAARVAELEGRVEDQRRFELEASSGRAVSDTPTAPTLRSVGLASYHTASDAARRRLLRRLPSTRLAEAAALAAQVDLALLEAVVSEAGRRRALPCITVASLGITASGSVPSQALATLLDRCHGDEDFGVRIRYFYARALEALGDGPGAIAAYEHVVRLDRADPPFHALLARERMRGLGAAVELPETELATLEAPPLSEATAALDDVIQRHGDAYPWLARARALLEVGDLHAAREELHQVFGVWTAARGSGSARRGVEAVYRAGARSNAILVHRDLRDLAGEDALRVGRVALAVGDAGLAVRFGVLRVGSRPRAFEATVRDAAARHHVDPDLLLAVMRVESVYDAEVVSYAGAIGLCQVMPRTGRLIAQQLGIEDHQTDDLLRPEVNIEFAAWYLGSLIERFEGRFPLALAAYNGGPHNVRRWMRAGSPSMSLDAFLETIPFEQTHRYVRRVMSHYAVYRAQEGLALPPLDERLPTLASDPVGF